MIIKKLKKEYWLLLLIVILAAFFRFYKLAVLPAGFHGDEIAYGYNAYSLLKTGKDEFGTKLPLGLTTFGDFRPALYAYLDVPFVRLMGMNNLSVRLPTAIFSLLTVILIFFICLTLTQNKNASLWTAFLTALSFWHIILSRETSEKIVSLFFILAGLYFFLVFIKKFKDKYLILSLFFWFFSVQTYYLPRVFLPMLIFTLIFIFRQKIIERGDRLIKIGLGLFLLLLITFISHESSRQRIEELLIFNRPGVQLVLDEQLREEPLKFPLWEARIFHNKIVNYSFELFKNYSSYFTSDFLYLSGGYPKRVSVPNVGLLPLLSLPYFLYGIYNILVAKKKEENRLLLVLLLIAVVPAIFTVEEIPNVYRSLMLLPVYTIITSVGIVTWLNKKEKKGFFTLLLLILFLANFTYFWHQYSVHAEKHQQWYRHYEFKGLVEYLKLNYSNYEKFYISKANGPTRLFLLYYWPIEPEDYQKMGSPSDNDNTGFDKFFFIPNNCLIPSEKGILYILDKNCSVEFYQKILTEEDLKKIKLVGQIPRQDGSIGFYLWRGETDED